MCSGVASFSTLSACFLGKVELPGSSKLNPEFFFTPSLLNCLFTSNKHVCPVEVLSSNVHFLLMHNQSFSETFL